MTMRVAVLDPGTNLGVLKAPLRDMAAIRRGERGDPGVTLWTAKLRPTTHHGAWLKSADEPIREALTGVDEVWIEAVNTQGMHHAGVLKNAMLAGHAAYWATCMGVEVKWFNLKHAKIFLTDNGNAKKADMISAVEFRLGLTPGFLTEHEADVVGGFMVASFGVPKSASQREAEAATRRRLEREAAKAAKEAAKVRAQDPLF